MNLEMGGSFSLDLEPQPADTTNELWTLLVDESCMSVQVTLMFETPSTFVTHKQLIRKMRCAVSLHFTETKSNHCKHGFS